MLHWVQQTKSGCSNFWSETWGQCTNRYCGFSSWITCYGCYVMLCHLFGFSVQLGLEFNKQKDGSGGDGSLVKLWIEIQNWKIRQVFGGQDRWGQPCCFLTLQVHFLESFLLMFGTAHDSWWQCRLYQFLMPGMTWTLTTMSSTAMKSSWRKAAEGKDWASLWWRYTTISNIEFHIADE